MSAEFIISAFEKAMDLLTAVGILWLGRRLSGIHKQINSRMDELVKSEKRASKKEGAEEERNK